MKIKLLFLIFLISNFTKTDNLIAQDCPSFPVSIVSQQQIDDFATYYPGCSEFDVDIIIQSSSSDSIINLDGLIQIKKINGKLVLIGNNKLFSLSGLDSLEYAQDFLINSNYNLQNINALKKLRSCEDLIIQENFNLQSIDSLVSLQYIGDNLVILENNSLTSFKGFNELQSIGGSLVMQQNNSLTQVSGFNALQSIDQTLAFFSNSSLVNIDALSSLNYVGGRFLIVSNSELTDLFDLQNIEEIKDDLWIIGNENLSSLQGLNSIKSVRGDLQVNYNSKLSNLKGLDQLETIRGNFMLESNSSLVELTGLESLLSIRTNFIISVNSQLLNLKGLSKLEFIGGELFIYGNTSLLSLEGISTSEPILGLESIVISENYNLKSLQSIKDLELRGISNINISNNDNLDTCTIQSLCNYLADCKSITMANNKSDECNDSDLLRSKCAENSEVNYQVNCISYIYPNPVSDILNIHLNYIQNDNLEFEIIDMQNRLLVEGYANQRFIDVSKLMAGVYCLRIKVEQQTKLFRFVKN